MSYKILLDANLSRRLVAKLKPVFPALSHVTDKGLAHHTPEREIWNWAREHGYALIVTRDVDFPAILAQEGPPPKVIHLRLMNQRNATYIRFLTDKADVINAFLEDDEVELLEFTTLD
ncbi:MAG: DUF5615 family PIN-like protein [Bacteroidota bacterium]